MYLTVSVFTVVVHLTGVSVCCFVSNGCQCVVYLTGVSVCCCVSNGVRVHCACVSNGCPCVVIQLQLGHLADAFIQSDLHWLIHTLTHRQQSQPCKATASSSVRVNCLAQGRINTQLGGDGDRTSSLSVTRKLLYL